MFSFPFRVVKHINLLGLEVVVAMLKKLTREGHQRQAVCWLVNCILKYMPTNDHAHGTRGGKGATTSGLPPGLEYMMP